MIHLERLALAAAGAFIIRTMSVTLRSRQRIDVLEAADALGSLSIIVPARNEEHQIEQCVRSLLAQRYPDFEVIAVDDCSTDRTPKILESIARSDSRLRVVRGGALPHGWVGKPWALAQGARHAVGTWLLFTDADTLHEPLAAASAVAYARKTGTQVLSLLTAQRFETLAERMFLPTILWMIAFSVGSLDAINDPKRADAAIFNGQFILFERGAYQALGGHAAVRDCIAEDYEFARLIKRDFRFRSRLAGAADLVSTRMYRSFPEIWNGFSKNLYVAAQDAPVAAIFGTVMLAALSPLPELLAVRAMCKRDFRRALRMLALIAATMTAAEAGMRSARFPRGSGVYFPAGVAAMLAIFLNSTLQHSTGRVTWRGRSYRHSKRTGGAPSQTSSGLWKPKQSKKNR